MVTVRERSVQFDPKIGGDWTEGQGLIVVKNLELTLGLSIVEMECRRHRFGMAEL